MMEDRAQDTQLGFPTSPFESCFSKTSLIIPKKTWSMAEKATCDTRCGDTARSGGEGNNFAMVETLVQEVRIRALIQKKLETVHY
jgi:hypothetical protein